MQRILGTALAGLLAAMSAHAEEFTVGAELPLTGSLARVGAGMQEGIMVAAEVFNRTNGKHRMKIATVDDESSPAKAIAAVEKLASDGAVAITGGYGSNNIAPASDAANKLGLVYITSGGVDENLVTAGRKHFFRINNTAGYEKAALGLFADMKVKSVSIVHSTKDATSSLAQSVQKALAAKGVKVTSHAFDPAMTDFKPVINKIRLQDRPDAVFMVGYENDYVGILRAARVLKPQVKAMVGVWSLATPKMAAEFPDLMPNVYGTALLPFPAKFTSADGRAFADTYKALYKKEPDYLGQFGYVQSMLLFEAIARAADKGTIRKGGIAEELRRTDRETLIGRVQFGANGDNVNFSHRMGQHQGKNIVIVWPPQHATGKMAYPAVPW
ncbi:ABC transporter substrate-binding protein [Pseudoduganella plicata]|uniref:Amino acid ABC transporter substrate-binding protein n=1 Tax=Pseudoduganella plicata TaxID=321984 RepID=A0A4P7BAZ9_9BURK|nr:ABC transporter substrate-binding protein [Pseudoduganella plicata]QBQ35771.1 amino acid ABC transporter substrate-binding protein [Pseudoduganella plicata]GGY95183.1 branched-chain amino acid ABC transporter substrate-binding protein [Pseudoduganella plicata]